MKTKRTMILSVLALRLLGACSSANRDGTSAAQAAYDNCIKGYGAAR